MSVVYLTSSNLESASYDKNNKILNICFHNGRSYNYYGVDTDTVSDLVFAESPGRFFNSKIKGVYEYAEQG